MSKCKRVAYVSQEEEYMRLQIDYSDSSDRAVICSIIDDVEREFEVHPEVIHKRDKNGGGTYFVEFAQEIYLNTRIPGEFIDKLLKELNIEHCEKL